MDLQLTRLWSATWKDIPFDDLFVNGTSMEVCGSDGSLLDYIVGSFVNFLEFFWFFGSH